MSGKISSNFIKRFLTTSLVNVSILFFLSLNYPAFSLSCEKSNYWNAFNHPKLEKETYNKYVHNEDGPVIKLKGYVYYINLNQYIFDECNIPIVEPIFFNEKYRYIMLSDSWRQGLNLREKIKECINIPVQFMSRIMVTVKIYPKKMSDLKIKYENDRNTKLETNENLFPHPKNIKVCEAEIEVAALNKPELDIPRYIPEGAPREDFVLAPTLRVTSVKSMKKID